MRSATDRRQPQKSDLRRGAILESLDHHLRESGFDGINIADVAKRGRRHPVGVLLLLREQGGCRGGAAGTDV